MLMKLLKKLLVFLEIIIRCMYNMNYKNRFERCINRSKRYFYYSGGLLDEQNIGSFFQRKRRYG